MSESISHNLEARHSVSQETSANSKERINNENINSLAIRATNAVSEKFEKKNIPFDRENFKARLTQSVEKVFLDPNIPDIAKEKFKQHILNKIDTFTNTTSHEINVLKNHRIVGSLGTEWFELRGKTDDEKQAFFLGKILEETIAKEIEPITLSLTQSFSLVRSTHPTLKDVSYNQANYDKFLLDIKQADSTLGLHVLDRSIVPLGQKIDLSKMNLGFDIGTKLIQELASKGYRVKDETYFKSLVGRASSLGEGVKKSDRREGEMTIIDKNGKPVTGKDGKSFDVVDLFLTYLSEVERFQWTEHEIRQTKEVALEDGLSSKARALAGMNQLKTEFDYLKSDDVEAKMKKASFPEMMMIATQLAQLDPGVVGNGVGLIDGLVSSYNGRDMNGAKLNGLERWLGAIFSILGITIVGGFASRAYNAGKMEKIIRSFTAIKDIFPQKLAEFMKTSGKLTNEAKNGIIKFAKMMGEEFAMQMEQMMVKQGLILHVVPEGKSFAKSMPQSTSLVELQKTDRLMANNLESLMSEGRKLDFPVGSTGKDWAERIISSTLVPLEKARTKLSPEFFGSVREKVFSHIERQLRDNIAYRLNGHTEWIEELGVRECIEKLSLQGLHISPESFSAKELGLKAKQILDTVLSRAKLSSAGVGSMEKVAGIQKEFTTRRADILKQLQSKTLTEASFIEIKQTLWGQRTSLEEKLGDLRKIQENLGTLYETTPQEALAKKNVVDAIKLLESEKAQITKIEWSSDMMAAGKRVELQKSEVLYQKNLKEREQFSRTMNNDFANSPLPEQAKMLLGNMDFDLSAANGDRFFNLTFSRLELKTQKLFTPEVMKKFGRDSSGKLTPEALELGVQDYGTRVLRQQS